MPGIPLHDLLGFELDVPPPGSTVAEVHLPMRPAAFGQGSNLHGGAIATLVDVSCALAAASATGFDPAREHLVTSDLHVRYLGRPVAGTERVTARAEIVKLGRRLIVIDCRVTDAAGTAIATADFSMMRVPIDAPAPTAGEDDEGIRY